MNTSVKIAGVEFKNPVMTGSGTFGSGMEYGEFVDLNKLGAVVTKGVANVPWPGNPTPRIAEVYGGMLMPSVCRTRASMSLWKETFRFYSSMIQK